jgi:hypothetical protein
MSREEGGPQLRARIKRQAHYIGTALPFLRTGYRVGRELVRPRLHAIQLDLSNRIDFGPGAPRFAERLHVDPRKVEWYDRRGDPFTSSAHVVSGAWPPQGAAPLLEDDVLQAAIRRWCDGLAWEETGEIERMERAIERYGPVKGCRGREDILRRCAELDRIFEVVAAAGELQPHSAHNPGTFREFGGIGMHVGPDGVLIRGGNGRHRFAMGWVLGLTSIPVRLGLVHRDAVDLLVRLRQPPS